MKKFLSVLLALAVAFTFTFGSTMSAFAAQTEAEKYNEAITTAEKNLSDKVAELAATVVYSQKGTLVDFPGYVGTEDTNLTKTAIDKAVADVIADKNAAIVNKAAEKFADGEWDTTNDTAALTAIVETMDTGAELSAAVLDAGYVYTYALDEAVKTFEASVAAIDVTVYPVSQKTEIEAILADDTTGYAAVIADAKTKVAAKTATNSDLSTLIGKATDLETKFTAKNPTYVKTADMKSDLAKEKTDKLEALAKVADDYKKATKTSLQDIIDSTTSTTAEIKAAETALATLDQDVQTNIDYYTALINAVEIVDTDDSTVVLYDAAHGALANINVSAEAFADNFARVVEDAASTATLISYATDYANNTLKTKYDATTGLLVYNAASIDAGLEECIKAIKNGNPSTYKGIQDWFEENVNTALEDEAAIKAIKVAGIDLITKTNPTLTTTGIDTATVAKLDALKGSYLYTVWAADDQDAIKDIQKDYTAKINAAADTDSILVLVKEAQKAMDAILNAGQIETVKAKVRTAVTTAGYVTAFDSDAPYDVTTYAGALYTYAKGVAAKAGTAYADTTLKAAVDQAIDVFYDAVLAEKKADISSPAVATIVKNNYANALAVIDKMQDDKALAAKKAELEEAIKALDTNATIENKDAYLAVKDSYDEYAKLAGAEDPSNLPLLKSYVSKIVGLEKTAVNEAIAALPIKAKVTLADKDAVVAARTALDNYVNAYSKFPAGWGYAPATISKLTDAEDQISALEKANVAKLIAAIPATVTIEDKAAIEAAKAAYDALSDEDKAAISTQLVEKLNTALSQLEAITPKYDNQDAKADLLDMSRKLTIWRTSKTSIKVTAVGSVKNIKANGYTVKYSFYKKAPGATSYKLVKTTTSNKYTYTNLKKGTNKFQVKVKVYDADGKLVATKMTYYRAAKIK